MAIAITVINVLFWWLFGSVAIAGAFSVLRSIERTVDDQFIRRLAAIEQRRASR